MDNVVSEREAVAIVARRIVENAERNGHTVKFEDARARVAAARERGDRQRENNNR